MPHEKERTSFALIVIPRSNVQGSSSGIEITDRTTALLVKNVPVELSFHKLLIHPVHGKQLQGSIKR
jgi:hypothetical protein